MTTRATSAVLVLGLAVLARCAPGVHPPMLPESAKAARRDPSAAVWRTPAPKRFYVRFDTTKGLFVVEAERKWAPHGVDRLYQMVRAGLLDDSRFFRVRPREFAQFGIPGDPVAAEAWRNAKLPDDPVILRNERGTLAYAMSGPNTRTTQIFINLKDHSEYDRDGFVPFARIVMGLSVVDALYAGYGETSGGGMRAGSQGPIFEGGNTHLDRLFPRLDKLVTVRIVASPETASAGGQR